MPVKLVDASAKVSELGRMTIVSSLKILSTSKSTLSS